MYHIAPSAFEDALGIVEKTDTAVNSITTGQFVVWKGHLQVATDDISPGDTLSASNLAAVSGGGFNNLGGGNRSNEIGEIRMWTSATAPDKWLICDGDTISRTTYADLFDVIGTSYGGGDGSTTFAIPDFKGRSPLGAGESAATGHTNHTLGQKAGEETHVLSSGELAAHAHTFSKASATTTIKYSAKRGTGSENTPYNNGTGSTTNWATTTLSLTLNNTGSNTAHNTMHPYCAVNFIIYTGVSAA